MDAVKRELAPQVPSSSVLLFVLLTFAITWGIAGFGIFFPETATALLGPIDGSNPVFFVATWGPAIAAFIVVGWYAGLTGLAAFLRRVFIWRSPPFWAAFVILGIPLVFVAGSLVKGGPFFTPSPPDGAGQMITVMFVMLILGPIEEFGWRGVAQPVLQRHMAPIWAGLIIGTVWGLWHIPAFYLGGAVQSSWAFAPFFLGSVVLAVIVTPIFNATGGSLLWPMLFHWQLINPFWPDAQPYDTWIFAVIAVIVVWWNRATMFTRARAVTQVVPDAIADNR